MAYSTENAYNYRKATLKGHYLNLWKMFVYLILLQSAKITNKRWHKKKWRSKDTALSRSKYTYIHCTVVCSSSLCACSCWFCHKLSTVCLPVRVFVRQHKVNRLERNYRAKPQTSNWVESNGVDKWITGNYRRVLRRNVTWQKRIDNMWRGSASWGRREIRTIGRKKR